MQSTQSICDLHAKYSISPRSLASACTAELGCGLLHGCKYAFQVFDIKVLDDFDFEKAFGDYTYAERQSAEPTVALFGVDTDGHSVVLKVQGYRPYLYLEIPWWRSTMTTRQVRDQILKELGKALRNTTGIQMTVIKRHKLGGYEPPPANDTESVLGKFMFVQLEFPNLFVYHQASKALKRCHRERVVEERIPHNLKFAEKIRQATGNGMQPCGWIGVETLVPTTNPVSWCDVELECSVGDVHPLPAVARLAPVMVASYDIECISPSGDFPDATRPTDQVVVIGTTFRRLGTLPWREGAPSLGGTHRTSHVLHSCPAIPGVDVVVCCSEEELLHQWACFVVQDARIDCLLGYNVLGFDNKFCAIRAEMFGADAFFRLSKFRDEPTELQSRVLSSAAMGDNEVHHLPMPGRFTLDMYHWIKNRFSKLKSNKLDDVAKHFLGEDDGKLPMPYSAITDAWGGVDIASDAKLALRARVVEYCAQDCDLPMRLVEKLFALQELTEMSRVCETSLVDVMTRGQQIKVFSKLVAKAHKQNFLINDLVGMPPPSLTFAGALQCRNKLDPKCTF